MNTYHQINREVDEKQNSLRKKYKLFCILCAFIMYFVLLLNNSKHIKDSHHNLSFVESRNPKFKSLLFEKDKTQYEVNLAANSEQERKQQEYKILSLKKKKNSIHYYINELTRSLKAPLPYRNISSVTQIKQLPICVVAVSSPTQVLTSLEAQNYSSFKMIYFKEEELKPSQKTIYIKNYNSLLPLTDQIIYYYCGIESIIVIAEEPLKQKSLQKLNNLYQTKNIWLTFEKQNEEKISVSSFYGYIFINLKKNDFQKQKVQELNKNVNFLILSMLQLTKYHASFFPSSDLFQTKTPYLHTKIQTIFQTIKNHSPYQPLFSLSQNYEVNEDQLLNYESQLLDNQNKGYKESEKITQEKMLQAIEYLELKNLPENHSLFERQRTYYKSTYKLGRQSNEIPFCVVVVSRNNIQRDRYQKVIQSIQNQHYQNYHIVFIDDNSNDQTFFQTKKYIIDHHYDSKKFSYIKNKEKKSYLENIKNAAFNYCKSSDIMMLVDGDDELIGRYALKLINLRYLMRNNWIVYTNSISSKYEYGQSKPVDKSFLANPHRDKEALDFMNSLKTFYVSLFKKIADKDLKNNKNKYFETDLSMKLAMLEMAGPNHVEYLPQVCYFQTGEVPQEKSIEEIAEKQKYQQIDYVYSTK